MQRGGRTLTTDSSCTATLKQKKNLEATLTFAVYLSKSKLSQAFCFNLIHGLISFNKRNVLFVLNLRVSLK